MSAKKSARSEEPRSPLVTVSVDDEQVSFLPDTTGRASPVQHATLMAKSAQDPSQRTPIDVFLVTEGFLESLSRSPGGAIGYTLVIANGEESVLGSSKPTALFNLIGITVTETQRGAPVGKAPLTKGTLFVGGCIPARYALVYSNLCGNSFNGSTAGTGGTVRSGLYEELLGHLTVPTVYDGARLWTPPAALRLKLKQEVERGPALRVGCYSFWRLDTTPGVAGGHGQAPFDAGPEDWANCPEGFELRLRMALCEMQRPVWATKNGVPHIDRERQYWMGGSRTGPLSRPGRSMPTGEPGAPSWINSLPAMYDAAHYGRILGPVASIARFTNIGKFFLSMLLAEVATALVSNWVSEIWWSALKAPISQRLAESTKSGVFPPRRANPWINRELAMQMRVLYAAEMLYQESDPFEEHLMDHGSTFMNHAELRELRNDVLRLVIAHADAVGNPCRDAAGHGDSATFSAPPWNIGPPNALTFQAQFVYHAASMAQLQLDEWIKARIDSGEATSGIKEAADLNDKATQFLSKFGAFLTRLETLPYCYDASFVTQRELPRDLVDSDHWTIDAKDRRFAASNYNLFVKAALPWIEDDYTEDFEVAGAEACDPNVHLNTGSLLLDCARPAIRL